MAGHFKPGLLGSEAEVKSLDDGTMYRLLSPLSGSIGTEDRSSIQSNFVFNNEEYRTIDTTGFGEILKNMSPTWNKMIAEIKTLKKIIQVCFVERPLGGDRKLGKTKLELVLSNGVKNDIRCCNEDDFKNKIGYLITVAIDKVEITKFVNNSKVKYKNKEDSGYGMVLITIVHEYTIHVIDILRKIKNIVYYDQFYNYAVQYEKDVLDKHDAKQHQDALNLDSLFSVVWDEVIKNSTHNFDIMKEKITESSVVNDEVIKNNILSIVLNSPRTQLMAVKELHNSQYGDSISFDPNTTGLNGIKVDLKNLWENSNNNTIAKYNLEFLSKRYRENLRDPGLKPNVYLDEKGYMEYKKKEEEEKAKKRKKKKLKKY